MVRLRLLAAVASGLHVRPAAARRMVLRAGGRVDVSAPRHQPIRDPPRADARPLRRPGGQVNLRPRRAACGKCADVQRAGAEAGADSGRKHYEMGAAGGDCHQQPAARLRPLRPQVRRRAVRRALLGRGHVPQGSGLHWRVERTERGALRRAAARDCGRGVAVPAPGRTACLLHLHVQRPRKRGERGLDMLRAGR